MPQGTLGQTKQFLAILHGLAVLDEYCGNGAALLRLYLVHYLHGFNDANNGIVRNVVARFYVRVAFG